MRVLQVYRDYFNVLPGGIERHVHDLAHGLGDVAQTEVLVSARERRSSTRRDGDVKVHLAAELSRISGVPICPTFGRVMARGRYDIVHIHSPNPTAELALRKARRTSAGIATYHADTDRWARLSFAYRPLVLSALESCARVIVSSDRLIQTSPVLSRLRERRAELLEVVPFGVDVTRFHPGPTERSNELREKWGPGPLVLFVGRLRYYKGIGHLIRAMAHVDAKLVVVGGGAGREQVAELGREVLGDRFIFTGRLSEHDLADAYRAADLFCLPSTSSAEAFGIAAVEAMACGVPVITTDVGTATSVINIDGVTGFVVPPRGGRALSAACRKLLEDDEARRTMGAAARQRAVENYDLRTMLERIARIYQTVVDERRAA